MLFFVANSPTFEIPQRQGGFLNRAANVIQYLGQGTCLHHISIVGGFQYDTFVCIDVSSCTTVKTEYQDASTCLGTAVPNDIVYVSENKYDC